MDVFAVIRRTLWGIVLATLLFVGCAYITVAKTLLSTEALTTLSKKAEVTKTIRKEFILPRILTAAKESDYSSLLDTPTLTNVFNDTVPDDALATKFSPAITATRDWLDSKEPEISFTIDTADLSKEFTVALKKEIAKKINHLRACTYDDSLADAEMARCKSPYISDKDLIATITETIDDEPSLQLTSITAEDITLPAKTHALTKNFPEYINILYALSLLTSGLALLIVLWLMSKHRLNGFITIGASAMVLAIGLFVASSIVISVAKGLSGDDLSKALLQGTAESFQATLRHEALIIGASGAAIVGIFTGLKLYLQRRHNSRHNR